MEENMRSEKIKRYDALCKKILSEKGVLANIMVACVPEYRSFSISEIVNHYIEGTPELGVPILETPITTQISGDTTEEISENEGRTTYDIRFSAIAPKESGYIQLLLNIEAQNNIYPGYPLLEPV